MKKYALCIDRILFCIFSCTEELAETGDLLSEIPAGSYALILRPSQKADFSVECYTPGGQLLLEPHLPLAALSFFFKEVRGLPPTELDVEYFGYVYNLDIGVPHLPSFGKISPKSKLYLSNNIVLADKNEIICLDIGRERIVRVFCASSADGVSDELIRSLLVRDEERAADTVICSSFDGEVKLSASDGRYPLEYVFCAATALIFEGRIAKNGEYTAHFLGGLHRFRICDGELVFIPKIEAYG